MFFLTAVSFLKKTSFDKLNFTFNFCLFVLKWLVNTISNSCYLLIFPKFLENDLTDLNLTRNGRSCIYKLINHKWVAVCLFFSLMHTHLNVTRRVLRVDIFLKDFFWHYSMILVKSNLFCNFLSQITIK